jgi:hypothetical protein
MLEKLKTILEFASKSGLYLPAAYDNDKPGPSTTLFFAHLTFCLTFAVCIVLIFKQEVLTAAITSMIFWVISTVFYLIRRLKTFKADLDDRSISLEGSDEK